MFFGVMALAMAATVFVAFAPTYYLLPYMQATTVRGVAGGASLSPLVHVHGVVFSTWMVFFVVQTGLISAHRRDVHRITGTIGLLLAAAIATVGPLTAIEAARNGSSPPGWDDNAFLLVPITSILVFAGFTGAGYLNRRRPDYHKRLMLLGTMAMLVPALSRIVRMADPPFLPFGVFGALVLLNLYLLALVTFDLTRNGRLHSVTIWGIAVFTTTWPARLLLGETGAWQAFARTLTG
jgi:hypothetical protein